ncbi:MAG: hypothetical protein HN428_00835 [Proteobacteria bacterium]|nr:hypothetical protein [Pseudomonadota bacterium]MBT5228117.1 hypothetical protein [Pseudomonadota bacterium]MBT5818504.1 hypothetical protein [Pseudomonadota bacterium]MBT6349558.1 hypothetical protein [Pseudomonadota bacterium]
MENQFDLVLLAACRAREIA